MDNKKIKALICGALIGSHLVSKLKEGVKSPQLSFSTVYEK